VRNWGPLDDDGRPIQPVIDEAAAAAWNARVGELKMAMAKAADVPEELKKEWAARAEAMEKVKAQRKAFPAMWSGGVMAPDFAEIDQAGREVRLSDFRGKVVVLDFWAPWCAPCNAAMPHNEEVAARYKDQGLVMLCACTSDTRANFEAWLRKNRAKYPDIVWTFDPAEKADGLVSKRLYSVMGIPTQFVISPTGKVIGVVEGYLKDETILEAKLAEAGVKVDPDLVAKGIEDLRKRHD
jgi:thiol-disulfide isomerase/thioredoxin